MSQVGDFDIEQWATDNNLSQETLEGLLNEGFDSIKSLTFLTSEDAMRAFKKEQRIPLAQVSLLKEALQQLQGGRESRVRSITEDTSSQQSLLSRDHVSTEARRHDEDGPSFQEARLVFESVKDQNDNGNVPKKATCVDSEEDDLKDWAARSKLTTKTVQALREDGFTSLQLLKLLTPDHITNNMQKAHNLPYAQVLALVNAIKQLKEDRSAGHAHDKNEDSENTEEIQPMFNLKQSRQITRTSLQVKEMEQWAQKEKLAPGTLSKLREQGFESLEDLSLLTSVEINNMCPTHLTKAQCLRLEKAVERLTEEKSAATTMGSEHFDHQFQAKPSQKYREVKEWANKVNLPLEILEILYKDDFTSLEDLSFLTPEEINRYSDQHLLTRPQCLRLAKAVQGLKMDNNQEIASITGNVKSNKKRFEDLRLLLVGKTGVGKSKTGNTILGEDKFQTSVGFSSETSKCELHQGLVSEFKVEITDSPGLFDTSERDYAFAEKVVQTVALMNPGAHAFLFVIKIGRFTKEEEGTYMRLKAIFDEYVTKYMVIVFTGGDNLIVSGETIEDIIRKAPDGLKNLLKACEQRYVVFDNMAADKKPQVRRLLDIVTRMVKVNNNECYTCPKYMSVKDKMEEEIQTRMMAVEEKEIQNTRYIKELETKTKLLEDMAKKAQEDFDKREEERKKQLSDLQEKVEKRMQVLSEQAEQNRIGDNEYQKRVKILEKEKQDLWNDFKKQQNEDRRKMEEEEQKRQKRSEALMEDMRKAREAKERAYEEEMRRFKESIAQNEQRGVFSTVTDGLSWLWGTVTSPFRS